MCPIILPLFIFYILFGVVPLGLTFQNSDVCSNICVLICEFAYFRLSVLQSVEA